MPVIEGQGVVRIGRRSHWHGRSGRGYELVGLALDSFAMRDADLYVIAKGSHVLWVGSSEDLVADPASRSRFRLAIDCADRAFLLSADASGDRLATIWDLEGASPAPMTPAQAA